MTDSLHRAYDHLVEAERSLLMDIDHHHATCDSHPAVWDALSLTQDALSEVRGELKEREQYPLVDAEREVLTTRQVI